MRHTRVYYSVRTGIIAEIVQYVDGYVILEKIVENKPEQFKIEVQIFERDWVAYYEKNDM